MLALPIEEAVDGRDCELRPSESPAATFGAVEGREESDWPAAPLRTPLCVHGPGPLLRSALFSGREADRSGRMPPDRPLADPLDILRGSSRALLRMAMSRASSSLVLADADRERGSEAGVLNESRAALSPDARAAMLSSEVFRAGAFGLPFAAGPAVDGRLEGPACASPLEVRLFAIPLGLAVGARDGDPCPKDSSAAAGRGRDDERVRMPGRSLADAPRASLELWSVGVAAPGGQGRFEALKMLSFCRAPVAPTGTRNVRGAECDDPGLPSPAPSNGSEAAEPGRP